MVEQLDLTLRPPPFPDPVPRVPVARQRDPVTSHAAAASMRTTAAEHDRQILLALSKLPGRRGTYWDIATEAGLTPVQVHRRLGHEQGLVGSKLVECTTETRRLPTRRPGHVYALVERGAR